jgi:hypothetical protein
MYWNIRHKIYFWTSKYVFTVYVDVNIGNNEKASKAKSVHQRNELKTRGKWMYYIVEKYLSSCVWTEVAFL